MMFLNQFLYIYLHTFFSHINELDAELMKKIYSLKQFNKLGNINEYDADKQDWQIIINDIVNKIGSKEKNCKGINND